ncbi:MAG: triose-phosphate isomerase [Candidatus Paceibacterota bacterium]
MIVLNLKTYKESFEKADVLAKAAKDVSDETGVRIILCPPNLLLRNCKDSYHDIFSQHCDENDFGAYTGSLPFSALKLMKIKGSLINHSEKRIPIGIVENIITKLKENKLESIVCAENPMEVEKISHFNPDYIAVEPKELIGSGVSVSNAKPEVITDSLKVLEKTKNNVSLLCGAGVSNREDAKKALELGATGILLASAYVRAADHRKFLEELASVF